MLKELRIQHLILVDEADIHFKPGFNVLSGETGSGKSALMGGLNLILGGRADSRMVRRGQKKSVVQALFEIDAMPALLELLAESGIDHEPESELVLRREVFATGKSRSFVNNQPAQIGLLKKLGKWLVDIVGQHANHRLLQLDTHREVLDLFSQTTEDVKAFQGAWGQEKQMREELRCLVETESQRLRDIEVCRMELNELDEAGLKEGEEEELFAEYSRLANAEKLTELVNRARDAGRNALPQLNRQKVVIEELKGLDAEWEEGGKAINGILLELEELVYTLDHYQNGIVYHPQRLHEVNERLTLINRLKRKYGGTIAEVQQYQETCLSRLEELESADHQIEELETALQEAEKKTESLAATLTTKRQAGAKALEVQLTEAMQPLNMSQAQVKIAVREGPRSRTGDDVVEIFLAPNAGETFVPLKAGVSGGEMARLMFALKTILAGREAVATLVFDEIDANIGGETATVVGHKLQAIGKEHQVLCITHFAQVAACADHHLQISKETKKGRTLTHIKELDSTGREQELSRMLGGPLCQPAGLQV